MFVDIYDTDRKFDLIVADPPWKQSKGGQEISPQEFKRRAFGLSCMHARRDQRAFGKGK